MAGMIIPLKRLYFIFPEYRNKIEDLITITLVNLVSFKNEINKNCSFLVIIINFLLSYEHSITEAEKTVSVFNCGLIGTEYILSPGQR